MKRIATCIAVVFVLLVQVQADAQITWSFTTNANSSNLPANITTASAATQVNNNGTTTFFAAGTPASSGYTGATGGSNGNCSAKIGTVNTSTSTYVQVVITPAANYWVNLTAIQWGNFSLSATGPTTLSVYTSIDNYTTPLATATVSYSTTTWTLLAPAFTSVSGLTSTAVTIRIYASGGTGTTPAAGAANWRVDDLKVTATAQTGTAGQLPKYSGSSTFTNSIITESNGNIGIGITNPAYKLDVSGTLNASGAITMGSTYGGSWNVYGTYSEFSSNANTDVLSLISKKSTSSIWLRVNNGGRGIQVNGSNGNLLFMGGSGESLSGIGNANGTGNLTFLYSTASNTQVEGARLSTNGFLGIGTATPAYKLDVVGDAQITSASPASNGKLTITRATVGSITLEALYSQVARLSGSISTQLADYNTAYGSTFGIYGLNGISFNNSALQTVWNVTDDAVMNIGINGNAYPKKGKINLYGLTSGNVTVQPADAAGTWTLTLPTSAGTSGQVLSTDGTGTTSWINASSGGSSQWTTSGNNIYYNTGNVGIGTTTPSSQLDITGFFRSTGLAGVPTTGTGIEIFYHNGGQDKSFIQSYSRTASQFKGMDIEGSFIRLNGLSGGNVGIGTSSVPAYKLDIAGNQRILGNIGLGTAPSGNGITINAAASHITGYAMQITGDVGGFTAIRVDNSNTGPSAGAGLLMLNNSNYVGFVRMDGTNASGSATYAGQLVVQSQQSGIRYVALGATTGNPSHTFYTNYPIIEERFRVDNNGATVSNGSMVSPVYLGGTGTTSSLVLQSTSGAGTTGANIRMLVGNNGATEAMRILNNGNILVGTTTEATNYKLAVGGNVIAEKVRVKLQSGWPDYVFHQQYPLLPLNEVEQFINNHKHLPEVPSAKEIEANGLDLGDGQSVLLKKIEELTIYIIDINKRVGELEKENKEMKKLLQKN